MRGRSRGRNNNKPGGGGTGLWWSIPLIGLALGSGARAQVAAPAGALPAGGVGGAFTTPVGAYGAAPAAAAPPTAPAAATALETPVVPPAWLITPSIELGEGYNDNVNLAPKGSRLGAFVTTISPGVMVTGQTGRLNLGLSYDPQELLFSRGSPSNVLQHRLLGTATAELWRQVLYVEGRSSISQAFVRPTGAIAPTTQTTNANLQTVYAESVSPYLLQHLGSYADSETRYRFSAVSTSGGTATVAGETTNELRQTVAGGEFFGRLGWSLIGDLTRLEREKSTTDPFGGTTGKDTLLRLDLKYPVYEALSVIGGVGYERISDPSLSEQPKGVIWNAGLRYQPNPLVAAGLSYGRRFNTQDIEVNATYNLDPQLRLSAVYTTTIQTSQSQLAGNLNQLVLVNGVLVDARTGLPFNPGTAGTAASTSSFGLTSGAFLARTMEIDAVLTKARNTYGATLYQSKRTESTVPTLASTASATATAERVYGATFTWGHQLRPDLASTTLASYSRTVFLDGSGRRDNTYNLSLGLTYTLSRTATATLSLSRYDRRSNIAADSLVDDIVMATIRKEF